jgi:hypothetical protein
MISHWLIKTAIARIANHKKFKIIKAKERRKKRQHDKFMCDTFGNRYKVARWIGGNWLLYSFNQAFYNPPKWPENVILLKDYRKTEEKI